MQITYNFKLEKEPLGEGQKVFEGEYKDTRNGILCRDPTCDIVCYLNYIELLNSCRDQWKQFGFLDYGLMPVAMGPNFFHAGWKEAMLQWLKGIDLPCYILPATSLLYTENKLRGEDVWVKKSEASRLTGIPERVLEFRRFFEWLTKEVGR